MFEYARLKLTAWYLLIIMFISISFSVVIYRMLNNELGRLERVEVLRIQRREPTLLLTPPAGLPPALFDPDVIAETRRRLIFFLIGINLFVLGGSAVAGYFLAGRTLKPIADMIDEQNRFITDASHELRTPLTSLKTGIEINLRNKNLTLSEAKKLLASNLDDVNALQKLSDGLIKLTQYQKGDVSFAVETVNFKTIVQDSIRTVKIAAELKHILLSSSIPNISIEGNPTLLRELLVIFLDNAVKYSHTRTNIRIYGGKTDGHIKIHIEDHGVGIDETDIPHLFDRFYRADKSRTKGEVTGYGLGLSIAKQIVDRHNGSIDVTSTVGKGTTFTITLPVKHGRLLV